jgi:hypothetical protein
MRLFTIFEGGGPDRMHSVVYFSRGTSVEDAIRRWVDAARWPGIIAWHPDGSLTERFGRATMQYPHVLALIEANYRIRAEWQIRELPEWMLDLSVAEIFCGEDSTVDRYIEACRPLLRAEFPRSRAKAFVWYTTDGPLVTFYNGRNERQYRVIRRYLLATDSGWTPEPWHGDYDELCRRLDVRVAPEKRPDGAGDIWA